MKKIIAFGLALITIISCASCGDVQTNEKKDTLSSENGNPTSDDSGKVYNITDYYKEDGTYSDLGRSIPFDVSNGERMLTVYIGDVIVVGERQYKITVESIKLPFYTQSSIDEIIVWWIDYMNSGQERGDIIAMK